MKTIRLIELFAGYGSQAMALKRLGLPFEHHFVCEFDKYAIKSYNAVHGTDFPTIDIRDVHAADLAITDRDRFTYLLTYSFPCTDLSIAGKMQGMSRDAGTRSGLLWEVERILKECGENLPQILMMENVPQVHGKKNIKDFAAWVSFIDKLGYKSKWKDLNAKDYGIAQNRDRCFMVSWLGSDVNFNFPKPRELNKRLRDYLDDEVVTTYEERDGVFEKSNRVYLSEGISPTITSASADEKILVKDRPVCLNSKGGRGGVEGLQPSLQDRIYSTEAVSVAIATGYHPQYLTTNRIRKLTESECLRLMGVAEADIVKIRETVSPTQCYKQSGNSIVVDVMVAIFDNLFNDKDEMPGQMTIYDYL